MDDTGERRRIARIPITCSVVVRERFAVWTTDTEDIGARGCRIRARRALTPGALVELRFERGGGALPLLVVGQIAWARKTAPRSAGVAFVNLPRDPSGAPTRNWIDALVAAQLRRLLERWLTAGASTSRLGDVELQLGLPPGESSLDRNEQDVIRLARDGIPLSAVCATPDGVEAVLHLLDRGVVSVCRSNPDPEGWKQALATLADSASPGRSSTATAGLPRVIVPPLPETVRRPRAGAPRVIVPPLPEAVRRPSAGAPRVIVPPPPDAIWSRSAVERLVEEYVNSA